jgi:hypothetical protein
MECRVFGAQEGGLERVLSRLFFGGFDGIDELPSQPRLPVVESGPAGPFPQRKSKIDHQLWPLSQ